MVTVRVGVPARPAGSYDAMVGRGLLAELPRLLARHAPAGRYALIADSRVAPLYASPLVGTLRGAGASADLFDFPDGERSKTRDTWAAITDRMLAAGCGRDTIVIAVGGGVTGDLAGFVAATYQRGVPLVQVPTTLLAMVDSSIGGKGGVDVAVGKNLVGAFHHPRLVVADLDTLASLPAVERRSGLAEVVKYGVVADAHLFESLERDAASLRAGDPDATAGVVRRSIEIKAQVVAGDAEDAGPRSVLNFGHTIGHALEAGTGFTLLHGQAIAIGMVIEARLAERMGIAAAGTAARIQALLVALDLPVTLPDGTRVDALLGTMRLDKKNRGTTVRFALPQGIGVMSGAGNGEWTVAADEKRIGEAILGGR